MTKRVKKNRKRIVLNYYLDNPRDVALLDMLKDTYKKSNLSENSGVSIGGFAKWLLGESILRMALEVMRQEQQEAAKEQEESDQQGETEQPSE